MNSDNYESIYPGNYNAIQECITKDYFLLPIILSLIKKDYALLSCPENVLLNGTNLVKYIQENII